MYRISIVCLETKMAVKWDGFSEDDIKKLKNKGLSVTAVEPSPLVVQKRATLSVAARRSCDRLLAVAAAEQRAQSLHLQIDIPPQARLSRLKHPETNGTPKETVTVASVSEDVKKMESAPMISNGEVEDSTSPDPTPSATATATPPFTLTRPRSLTAALMAPALSPSPLVAPMDMEDFESRQKKMEEQNRLKKVFLSKTLEDRKKHARAEAKRLSMIQEELHKLDQRLSCDVSIIRNQIESASIEFLEAQKRYDRAEKEFLEAKMLFFTKLERKELLTHHLCTIIEQNEMRKAQKLSELMEKLDLRAELPVQNPDSEPVKPGETPTTNATDELKRKISAEVILTPADAGGATGNAILTSSERQNSESTLETTANAK